MSYQPLLPLRVPCHLFLLLFLTHITYMISALVLTTLQHPPLSFLSYPFHPVLFIPILFFPSLCILLHSIFFHPVLFIPILFFPSLCILLHSIFFHAVLFLSIPFLHPHLHPSESAVGSPISLP